MCSDDLCNTTTSADIDSFFDVTLQPKKEPNLIMGREAYYISNEIIGIILLIMNVFGLITNGLSIKLFIRMGLKNEVTFSFTSLAIFDFCFALANVINLMSDICHTWEIRYGLFMPIDPYVVWLYSTFPALSFYTISTMITAYLAATRCLCVALPFKFKYLVTRRYFLITMSTCVVYSVTIHSLVYPYMGVHIVLDSKVNRTRLTYWFTPEFGNLAKIIRFCTLFSVSLATEIISFVCAVVMTAKLKASVQFRIDLGSNNTEGQKEKAAQKLTGKERNVVLQMIVISTIYFLCNLMQMVHAWGAQFITAYTQDLFYLTMAKVQLFFNTINCSVNFFVYLKFNTKFRQLFLSKSK